MLGRGPHCVPIELHEEISDDSRTGHMKRTLLIGSLLAFAAILIMMTFSIPDREPIPEIETGVADVTNAFIASRLSELRFVENRGQFDSSVLFSMRYSDGSVSFGKRSVIINIWRSESAHARPADDAVRPVRFGVKKGAILPSPPIRSKPVTDRLTIDFPGSRLDCMPQGLDERTERTSFILGSDPDRWRSNVRTFNSIFYRELYDNIDLRFSGTGGSLKSDFIVGPAANPRSIRIRYSGADDICLDKSGDLIVSFGKSVLVEEHPIAYQVINGVKYLHPVAYRILDENLVTFCIDSYDTSRELVIDPLYCTLLGGSMVDNISKIHQNSRNMFFVTGATSSADFPALGATFQNDLAGESDGYISIIDPVTGTILQSTYYGGSGTEGLRFSGFDNNNRFITSGTTNSSDLPLAGDSYQSRLRGTRDAFIAVWDSTCSNLLSATYLGGNGYDALWGMTLSPEGDILMAGLTDSRDFPTTSGAYQRTYSGGEDDVFVTRVSGDCSRLVFSTFIGGSSYDEGYCVALDSDENVYIGGYTDSPNFPVTSNAIQRLKNPYDEGFIAKLDPTGSTLLYGSYFGGDVYDLVENVCIDTSGDVFVLGRTTSNDLPVTSGALQASKGDSLNPNPYLSDLFVLRLSTDMARVLACTYLGGADSEYSGQIFDFDDHAVLVSGYSESPDYPTVGADHGAYHAEWDVVYSVLSKSLESLYYSAYFGGNGDDVPNGVSLSAERIFIGGYTSSPDLPVTTTAIQTELSGEADGFIAIFDRSNIVTGIQELAPAARSLLLDQNHPNPVFHGMTTIAYSIPPNLNATLSVYDRSGRMVHRATLAGSPADCAAYRLDVSALQPGVYFYELRSDGQTIVRKMLVQ